MDGDTPPESSRAAEEQQRQQQQAQIPLQSQQPQPLPSQTSRPLSRPQSQPQAGFLGPQSAQRRRNASSASQGHSPNLRPVASFSSDNPITPAALSDAGSDYFEPLSNQNTASARSRGPGRRLSQVPTVASSVQRRMSGSRDGQRPSIRIRRTSSISSMRPPDQTGTQASTMNIPEGLPGNLQGTLPGRASPAQLGRPRSMSQPEGGRGGAADGVPMAARPARLPQIALPRLTEEGSRPTMEELGISTPAAADAPPSPAASVSLPPPEDDILGAQTLPDATGRPPRRSLLRRARDSRIFRARPGTAETDDAEFPLANSDEYDETLVNWLDIIDPEVQTLSTLTNVQNSLFVPDLGGWINRRPTYVLSDQRPETQQPAVGAPEPEPEPELPPVPEDEVAGPPQPVDTDQQPPSLERSSTITSRLTESHYAALPHGTTLENWTAEDKWELDDHVRHMLHSKRSKFKQRMRGFGQFVRRPLGLFVTVYATLITLFGLAWVLFLIGWIYVGDRQSYLLYVIDSVLVALFAIMGDGLAPFRAVDTYHMIFIVHYSRIIEKARKKKLKLLEQQGVAGGQVRNSAEVVDDAPQMSATMAGDMPPPLPATLDGVTPAGLPDADARSTGAPEAFPALEEGNPEPSPPLDDGEPKTFPALDEEDAKSESSDPDESALTFKQQKRFAHHQKKMAKSHSFYKPHETFTHHSFALKYLIAIVVLLDCHSCLQISLGACTWGIPYQTRPFALTTVILCVSITCNITAGIVITIGDRKSRKKDVIELLTRQELTGTAMKHIEKKHKKQQQAGSGGSSTLSKLGIGLDKDKAESEPKMMPSDPSMDLGLGLDREKAPTAGSAPAAV